METNLFSVMGGKIRTTITNEIVSTEFCTDSKTIPVSEILIFFYKSEDVFAVTKNDELFACGMDLIQIENKIGNRFFCLNPQVIINYSSIEYYRHEADQTIRVCANVSVQNGIFSVSKNRVSKFEDWLLAMSPGEVTVRASDRQQFRGHGQLSG